MRSAALPRFSSKIPGFISYVLLSDEGLPLDVYHFVEGVLPAFAGDVELALAIALHLL